MKQIRHTNHSLIITPSASTVEGKAHTHGNESPLPPAGLNGPLASFPKRQWPEANRPMPLHPALTALARLLGRQAAVHVRKYRFEGLGRIQLILNEMGMHDDV
jgi:hypothetical protein